jgi:hypothetical protein
MKYAIEDSDEADRLTIKPPAAKPTGPRSLSEIPVTPRLLLAVAYVHKFHAARWGIERIEHTMRALGFKPDDIADACAVWQARHA